MVGSNNGGRSWLIADSSGLEGEEDESTFKEFSNLKFNISNKSCLKKIILYIGITILGKNY